ncbi:MAG: RNA polymerase factor sigma-54 [Firmicutes bacterium]|nr:RNA polymerase factor sigma-54 [Bacillota bacterium]
MQIGYDLSMRQVQKLIVTPELRQAITVLQLPILELQEYIEGQLCDNPLLELCDGDGDGDSDDDGDGDAGPGRLLEAAPEEERRDKERRDSEERGPDLEWRDYFEDSSDLGYAPRSEGSSHDSPETVSYESWLRTEQSLRDALLFQLRLNSLCRRDVEIGEVLIGCLDEDGYLRAPLSEVASIAGCSIEDAEEVLKLVQTFEPPGVGSRTLAECLTIQLDSIDIPPADRELAKVIIGNHLEDVAGGKLPRIASALGMSVEDVQRLCDIIKTLDPKPGRQFWRPSDDVGYITPDVIIERTGKNGRSGEINYAIIVNDASVPRLRINPEYRRMLRDAENIEAPALNFLKSKLNAALWLIKSIEQRRFTLYRISECIVRFQRDFLDKGVNYLKPLTLRDVAGAIGVHESTVSRATAGKYVQTPRGTFEFRFFFSSGVSTSGGSETSSESVKHFITELIKNEDSRKPLSDQAITGLLKERGVIISRRTVAKYREELMIPASSKRRRY